MRQPRWKFAYQAEKPVPGGPGAPDGRLPGHLVPSSRRKSNGVGRLRGPVRRDSSVGIPVAYSSACSATIPRPRAESILPTGSVNGRPLVSAVPAPAKEQAMNSVVKAPARRNIFKSDLDYHVVRASIVLVFLPFGYGA